MWDAVAPGWERWRARIDAAMAPVREWMIGELAPTPGQTILELSAGLGDTGFRAAEIVGDRGRVISTDLAPAMLEGARRAAAERGLRNVEFRVMDAERMTLEAGTVDGVLCRYALMLMGDPAAALTETRRVLRPGGRVAFAVWAGPERNPWVTIFTRVLIERGHLPPPEPGPGIFALASEERLRGLLVDAGFADVRIAEIRIRLPVGDVDDYVGAIAETSPFGNVLGDLSDSDRRAVRAQMAEALAPFAAPGGYELPGVALGAAGAAP